MTLLLNLSKKTFKRMFRCYNTDPGTGGDGTGGDGTGGDGPGGGGSVASWRDSLPEDLRAHASLTDIKDVPGLAKSYISAQSLVGMDKVVIPKDENDPLWNEVYNKLGRPEAPDKYELSKPEDYPEFLEYNEDLAKKMSEIMHSAGLTKKQAQSLFGGYNKYMAEVMGGVNAQAQQVREQALTSLKVEWGQAYDQNVSIALRAVRQFGSPELTTYLNETGAGDDPRFIKLFHNIGKQIVEDSADGQGGGGLIPTPEQAKGKIAELHQDKEFMSSYNDRSKVGHKEAVEKMRALFKQAYPEV